MLSFSYLLHLKGLSNIFIPNAVHMMEKAFVPHESLIWNEYV